MTGGDSPKPDELIGKDVTLPAATVWPMVLSLGIALLAAGMVTSSGFLAVGGAIFVFGLAGWIGQLLPGRGHVHEPMVEPARRPLPVTGIPGTVEALRPGTAGYRFRLPEKVHPISSGIKGGIIGGLVMPIPALAYGMLTYGSPWLPINLLAGMVVPGIADASVDELEQFQLAGLVLGTIIHAIFSVTFGLLYGVILPTLPSIPGGPLLYGGVLMPLLWTGACHGFMGIINPLLEKYVDWSWFIVSQFVFGLTMSMVVDRQEKVAVPPAGSGPRTVEDER